MWNDKERIRLEVSKDAINHAIEDIDPDIIDVTTTDESETLGIGRFRNTAE